MSRFIFAGNEIIPGTVVMTADGTITPKDDLRVILNISGGGTVSLSDGTDTTQRMEIVNVNADPCSFTYKGTGGSTTASIYTNTGIRLLWVGSYWETSMSTAVTGIDDNNQPFAFNIDSLAKPDGVANITGTDADGVPFDVGVGQLVTVAEEDNYSTTEVKTSKTWIDGKPIYRKVFVVEETITAITNKNVGTITNLKDPISLTGWLYRNDGAKLTVPCNYTPANMSTTDNCEMYLADTGNIYLNVVSNNSYSKLIIIAEYTKTTD